jgi:hypothetical protein
MAAEGKRKGVPALGWWLMLVGSLRLASVWFGFFDIWALRVAVFSQTESECPPRILSLPSVPLSASRFPGLDRVNPCGGTDLISPGRESSLICHLCYMFNKIFFSFSVSETHSEASL